MKQAAHCNLLSKGKIYRKISKTVYKNEHSDGYNSVTFPFLAPTSCADAVKYQFMKLKEGR